MAKTNALSAPLIAKAQQGLAEMQDTDRQCRAACIAHGAVHPRPAPPTSPSKGAPGVNPARREVMGGGEWREAVSGVVRCNSGCARCRASAAGQRSLGDGGFSCWCGEQWTDGRMLAGVRRQARPFG